MKKSNKCYKRLKVLVKVYASSNVVGTVHIGSGWTNTKVSSSVHSTDPVDVLAPAPAPDISPAADAPTASDEAGSPRASSTPSSSYRIISLGLSAKVVSHDGNFPDSLTGYKSIKLLIIRHELYKLQFK
ncbi:hypothetical protein AAG906_031177 [Vitis piasezkii]